MDFGKYSNTKFQQTDRDGRADRWTDRQTDRDDGANSCFSQFCECA